MPASAAFDPAHPDIAADARESRRAEDGVRPDRRRPEARRKAGIAPFTVMSCDNIPRQRPSSPQNAVVGLGGTGRTRPLPTGSGRMSPSPTPWSTASRRRPAERERRFRSATISGIEDNWPVFCEEFKQWVLEDKFPAGRPALEKVGVTFVADVAPYEHDEDPHPQRRACRDRLSGGAAGHPFRA